jgi:hypothetical protein
MTRGLPISALLLVSSSALTAQAQETTPPPALGLPPAAPEAATLPGGLTPAFHQPSTDPGEWRFDFHGYMTVPVRASVGERKNPSEGQSDTTLHAPPIVPDYPDSWSYTTVVPQPYVKLLFTYGNPIVTGNISIEARQTYTGSAYFDPPANPGITDAFLHLNLPDVVKNARFDVNIGAFTSRYGVMGEYDEGRYGTPIIGRINGVGEVISANFAFGDFTLLLEQGFQGLADKPPAGIVSDGWNAFADSNTGASWASHWHAGLGYKGLATLGLHYLNVWTQDDRVSALLPDGRIDILGADLRLTLGHFGHFYVAGSYTNADEARTVGRVVEVLNTDGGPGLMKNYLGPMSAGTGKLTTFGAQYDLSIAKLLRYPEPFAGDAPDIVVSLFGMFSKVTSDDKTQAPDADGTLYGVYDDVTKMKFGAEGGYALLPWLAVAGRYDQVVPNTNDTRLSYAVISPRVIFRSGWNARDQVVLQYSRFLYGQFTTVRSGYPPTDDVAIVPDTDMFSLSASMWW